MVWPVRPSAGTVAVGAVSLPAAALVLVCSQLLLFGLAVAGRLQVAPVWDAAGTCWGFFLVLKPSVLAGRGLLLLKWLGVALEVDA